MDTPSKHVEKMTVAELRALLQKLGVPDKVSDAGGPTAGTIKDHSRRCLLGLDAGHDLGDPS